MTTRPTRARDDESVAWTEAIGQQLRARRTELDLTLKDVADAIGTSPSDLSKMERGLTNFQLDTLRRLLVVLQMELSLTVPKPAKRART